MTCINHTVQAKHATGPRGVEHLLPHFHVVLPISNPARYTVRYKLFLDFVKRLEAFGIEPWVVEVQQGLRAFAVTDSSNPRHIQLRTEEELWYKEQMVNIGVRRLPDDWKYVAWIDTDVEFLNPEWVSETIHKLQDAHVVQLFQNALDMGPNGEVIQKHNGFMWSYWNGMPPGEHYAYWHPGFAWACTREAFDGMGGLIEHCILGSGDYFMARGLVGKTDHTLLNHTHPNYKHYVDAWCKRANDNIKRDVSYVNGTILHHWHGKKKDRGYQTREKILQLCQYDPYKDVWLDRQGLFKLNDDAIALRDSIRKYFRSRNEQSIDLE
jgi:hypothetical protein